MNHLWFRFSFWGFDLATISGFYILPTKEMKGKGRLMLIIFSACALFISGFFAGSIHKQHQIKKNIENIFSDFWRTSENKKASVKSQEEKNAIKIIPQWESFTFQKNEGEEMKISIYETINAGNKYSPDNWSEYSANNKFWVVRVAGENIGNKPTHKYLGESNLLLEIANGKQYRPTMVEQVSSKEKRPDGYLGCVSCANNPWEKSVEDVIFDINEENIDGAKLIFNDDNIAFEL